MDLDNELRELMEISPNPGYFQFHLPRYKKLMDAVEQYHQPDCRILDIGSSPFTDWLRRRYGSVDTLGFGQDRQEDSGNHYEFDLNQSSDRHRWRTDLPTYDIVVFAEVIEHLHTSPAQVLSFLTTLMNQDSQLFIQTPNAVSLSNRMKMALGRNPFELIREETHNPGHFREYTRNELLAYIQTKGAQGESWELEHFSYENYFDFRFTHHDNPDESIVRSWRRLYNLIYSIMPGSLKPGMFLIIRFKKTAKRV